MSFRKGRTSTMTLHTRGLLILMVVLIVFPTTLAQDNSANATDPLVRVLLTKGVLTPDEVRLITINGTLAGQRDRLAVLLRDKGVISPEEFEAVRNVLPTGSAEFKTLNADYKPR